MQILVDADACPRAVKEVLYRAAQRRSVPTRLVACQYLHVPRSPYLEAIWVAEGTDAADERIVDLCTPGDLVVTSDVPLADQVVSRGATALSPRGVVWTAANIKERLATRNLLDGLRTAGMVDGGPPPFGPRDLQAFADALNRMLQASTAS